MLTTNSDDSSSAKRARSTGTKRVAVVAIALVVVLAGSTTYFALRPPPAAAPSYNTVFSGTFASNNSSGPNGCETCYTQANQTVSFSGLSGQTVTLYLVLLIHGPGCDLADSFVVCRYFLYLWSPAPLGTGLGPGRLTVDSTLGLVNNSWSGSVTSSPDSAEFGIRLVPGNTAFDVNLTVQIITY